MPGKIVSKNELAALFGKTPKTLTIWQHEGMPFRASEVVGTENQYDTAECIEWYVRRQSGKLDPNAEKAALVREQAEAARRKNAMAKGEVISVGAVKMVLDRWCSAVRQKIMQSRLGRAEKQAILADLRGMKGQDFREISPDDEEAVE